MKFKQIDRRLLTILMIVFVQMLGASMILPLLPLYAQRQFGMEPQTITLLVSAFFVAQFVAGPTIGRLSDRYGRLPVLIVSQIGTAVSFVMLALGQTVFILFAARIFDGITGGNIIVAQAYVTDITPRERRTETLGYIFAAFGLGFIFGPALGGVLAVFGVHVPFLIAAVAAFATVVLTWYTLDETLSPEQREANKKIKQAGLSPREITENSPLLLILLIAFVGQFGLGLLQATFALYSEAVLFAGYDENATNIGIGLLLTCVGLAQFLTQTFLLRRLIKRVDEIWLVVGGSLLRAAGFIVFALITTPWLGPIGSILFAMGFGIMMPPLQSLSTSTVRDEVRGGVLGVFQSVVSLSIIMSTAIAGVIFAVSPVTPHWIGAVLSIIIVIPAFWLRGIGEKSPELIVSSD